MTNEAYIEQYFEFSEANFDSVLLLQMALEIPVTEVLRLAFGVGVVLSEHLNSRERYFPCANGLPIVIPEVSSSVTYVIPTRVYLSREVINAVNRLQHQKAFKSFNDTVEWCCSALMLTQAATDQFGKVQLVSAVAPTKSFSLDKSIF